MKGIFDFRLAIGDWRSDVQEENFFRVRSGTLRSRRSHFHELTQRESDFNHSSNASKISRSLSWDTRLKKSLRMTLVSIGNAALVADSR